MPSTLLRRNSASGAQSVEVAAQCTMVATPGTAVLLPAAAVREVVAVVSACLDNVARHVGLDAPALVLLEQMPGEVVVTVRDEGLGIPEGRLDAAAAEGRLGVRDSILGRVAELGGHAELVTGGDGTEWELTFPLDRARPSAQAR